MLALKAMKGAGWLVLSRFVGRMIDFVTLIVLARILTPADFGLTALATSLIAIIEMVLEVPIIQALLRRRDFDHLHLDTGFTINLLRALIVTAVIAVAAVPFAHAYHDARLTPVLLVLALGPVARGLTSPAMVAFARDMSFLQTFVTEMTGKIFAFGCAVGIVLAGGGYWALVANSVMAAVMGTIASYILAPYRPRLSLARLEDFATFTGWFTAAQVVAALNWQFDRILLGRLVDKASFGQYTLAGDLAIFPTQSVIGPAMQSAMAAFASINHDLDRMRSAFLKAARVVMMISVPVCIGIAVSADLIVHLLLGPGWPLAEKILSLVSLTVLPVPYFQLLSAFCLALDRPGTVMKMGSIELGLRVVLIPLGFWMMAIDGVVWARLTIAATAFVVYLVFVRRLTGIGIARQIGNLWKTALAGGLMAGVVLGLRPLVDRAVTHPALELALLAVLGIALYAAVLAALGVRVGRGGGRFSIHDRWL